jgi:hypothetical protein
MAYSAGLNAGRGAVLSDWGHVVQSIRKILTTPIGTRVMRREFGSELMSLIDRPMTDKNVLAIYAAVAVAILRWEPRFRLRKAGVTQAKASGVVTISLLGEYYPRGHLGDYTVAEERLVKYDLPQTLAA